MNKAILFLLLLICTTTMVMSEGQKENSSNKVKLVFTSWRTEDIDRMNRINKTFTKQHPNIEIDFQPIKDTEYDAQLKQSLAAGTGADIIFLRSYDSGYQIYKTDSLIDLNKMIPELDSFPKAAVDAWSTPENIHYGIPAAGVVHGVYYRKSIFEKYNLPIPKTWNEFITICNTLQSKGETVFAQGTKDNWMLYEVIYSGLGANFYGGEEARQRLLSKEAHITDTNFLTAFEKINELKEFFPERFEGIDYVTMQQIFGTGNAAMFIGGSWEIGIFEDLGGLDDVGYFAPPVAEDGDLLQYCFHVDAGVAMNKNTKYPEEAKLYMTWLASPEFAQLYMNELPGFFSYTPGEYELTNKLAKEMESYVPGSEATVRTVWEKLSAQAPSGNELMGEAIQKMYAGELTPNEAAEYVDKGLSWYYE
ncbi:ABC transporter substrate-binding protein [Spirochaeta cellobiosiphila]|uniref:ABC transporter substrate-binding protein n=1 Tax=Spirochaeta cellobiosiphila TaxID=504483 RepID=UPI00041F2AA5|nr:extracellular solute-binding protein [Spirochaeta cellobiosiphila]